MAKIGKLPIQLSLHLVVWIPLNESILKLSLIAVVQCPLLVLVENL